MAYLNAWARSESRVFTQRIEHIGLQYYQDLAEFAKCKISQVKLPDVEKRRLCLPV